MFQSRHNTQESAESSKSRNGGLNEHMQNNSSVYKQVSILSNPANAKTVAATEIQLNN